MLMYKACHTELLASPERVEGKCGFISRLPFDWLRVNWLRLTNNHIDFIKCKDFDMFV